MIIFLYIFHLMLGARRTYDINNTYQELFDLGPPKDIIICSDTSICADIVLLLYQMERFQKVNHLARIVDIWHMG